jgi:hypothetical protein
MSDKILTFPGSEPLPENPVDLTTSSPYNYCRHESISLDSHTRTLECVECKAVLDPFNFLCNNAQTLRMAWVRYQEVQRRYKEKEDSISALQKEERRLKARIKTLQEKIQESSQVLDLRK